MNTARLRAWVSVALLGGCVSVSEIPDANARERERRVGEFFEGDDYRLLYGMVVPVEGPRADTVHTLQLDFSRGFGSDCVRMYAVSNWVSREHAKSITYTTQEWDECRVAGLWINGWRTAEVPWSSLYLGQWTSVWRVRRKPGQPRAKHVATMVLPKHASVIQEWASAKHAGATICDVDFELSDAQKAQVLAFLDNPPVPTQPTDQDSCEMWMFEVGGSAQPTRE